MQIKLQIIYNYDQSFFIKHCIFNKLQIEHFTSWKQKSSTGPLMNHRTKAKSHNLQLCHQFNSSRASWEYKHTTRMLAVVQHHTVTSVSFRPKATHSSHQTVRYMIAPVWTGWTSTPIQNKLKLCLYMSTVAFITTKGRLWWWYKHIWHIIAIYAVFLSLLKAALFSTFKFFQVLALLCFVP